MKYLARQLRKMPHLEEVKCRVVKDHNLMYSYRPASVEHIEGYLSGKLKQDLQRVCRNLGFTAVKAHYYYHPPYYTGMHLRRGYRYIIPAEWPKNHKITEIELPPSRPAKGKAQIEHDRIIFMIRSSGKEPKKQRIYFSFRTVSDKKRPISREQRSLILAFFRDLRHSQLN